MEDRKRFEVSHPVIGIVPRYNPITVNFEFPETFTVPILELGALPLLIPYTTNEALLDEYLSRVDAIMVIGGLDVDPALYTDEPRHPEVSLSITHYDLFEFRILKWALSQQVPTFGICRGMQVMNVCFGGTLIQDLGVRKDYTFNHYQLQPFDIPRHDVFVEQGSCLASILGEGTHWVNSMHHQAVSRIANGFRAVATSSDGLVEAIEREDHPMFIGVQWHPEDMRGEMELSHIIAKMIELSEKR